MRTFLCLKQYSITVLFSLLLLSSPLFIKTVSAVTNCPVTGSSLTIASGTDCQFTMTTDGIDGSVIVNAGGILRIAYSVPNQVLYFSSLKPAGTIMIGTGGSMKFMANYVGWMLDADSDGYPATTEKRFQTTAPAAGWRRLSVITYPTTAETCDNIATRNPGQTGIFHTTIAADGSWDFNCDGVVTQQYTTASYLSQQYVCNTTGCAAHYYTIKNGWTTSTAIPACGVTDTYKTTVGQSATTCAVLDTTATCANTVTSGSLIQGCY